MRNQAIHILLVEDNLADFTLLCQRFACLKESEWQLTQAETLEEAIETYQQYAEPTQGDRAFDLVLLDLGLPDSRGLETLTQFRAAVPDVSIVVLTGLDDEELALQAVVEGAQDYLVKDQITIQSLIRTIRFAIERQQLLIQQKQSEECARQALERERELNELKSSFIGMVSHEFRTPLSVIRTATELLKITSQDFTNPKCEKWFEQIQSANDQLLYLINDVLTLSQVQSGELNCQPDYFDLENFCLELTETLRQSFGNQHTIIFTAQGGLNHAFMDINLVRYIFTNLLSNAIKYSPQGENIQFDITSQSSTVTFRIHDSGIGIPEQEQHRLFESFYRGSNVGNVSGTGLGLVIVKRCIDALQGEIEIDSTVNVGTTIVVKLPLIYSFDQPASG